MAETRPITVYPDVNDLIQHITYHLHQCIGSSNVWLCIDVYIQPSNVMTLIREIRNYIGYYRLLFCGFDFWHETKHDDYKEHICGVHIRSKYLRHLPVGDTMPSPFWRFDKYDFKKFPFRRVEQSSSSSLKILT